MLVSVKKGFIPIKWARRVIICLIVANASSDKKKREWKFELKLSIHTKTKPVCENNDTFIQSSHRKPVLKEHNSFYQIWTVKEAHPQVTNWTKRFGTVMQFDWDWEPIRRVKTGTGRPIKHWTTYYLKDKSPAAHKKCFKMRRKLWNATWLK